MKKKVFILVSILLILFPSITFGQTIIGYHGTKESNPTTQMNANQGVFSDYWTSYSVYSCSTNWQVSYYATGNATGEGLIKTDSFSKTGLVALNLPSNTRGIVLHSLDGKEVYSYAGTNTSPTPDIGFQAGSCSNNPPEPEPEPEPSCWEMLAPILEDILSEVKKNNNAVNEINEQLSVINITINNINNNLTSINNTLNIIKNELQTTQDPPTFEKPRNSNLDDYKPNLDLPTYKDDTVYFEDNGQAETAPPMPAIPEPKPWLDEEGLEMDKDTPYAPEEELQKDSELDRDTELNKDSELERDEFTQDSELNKDNELERDEFTQDSELNKDNELERDEFTQDTELNKDSELEKDEFNQNHQYEQDTEYKQDTPMQQTEEDYRLRWKSVNGVFQP